MTRRWHAAAACAAVVCLPGPAAPAAHTTPSACELRLSDHRSGVELARLGLDPHQPEVRVAFEHSVLGTTVIDRYRFTPQAVLVEEQFEGEGYGLPHAAGPGEQLQRDGARQRLALQRRVDPLVIRAGAAQRMRLLRPDGELLLASLGAPSIELVAAGCPAASPLP